MLQGVEGPQQKWLQQNVGKRCIPGIWFKEFTRNHTHRKRGPSLQTIPRKNCSFKYTVSYSISQKMVPNLVHSFELFSIPALEKPETPLFQKKKTPWSILYIYTVVQSLSIKFPDPWAPKYQEKKTFIYISNTQNLLVRGREWGNNSQSNLESIYNVINVPSFLGFIISESHQSASKLLFSRLFWSFPFPWKTSSSQIARPTPNINIAKWKSSSLPLLIRNL